MKSKKIATKTNSLLSIMAAALILTTLGCEKEVLVFEEKPLDPTAELTGNVISENFEVLPVGGHFSLLSGIVSLEFPSGAVMEATHFTITTFPIHHLALEGYNLYNRGYYLEGGAPNQTLGKFIKIRFAYNLEENQWRKSAPDPNSEDLTVYYVSPSVYSYERITSIGNCCVDCSCKTIRGSIGCCGFYVVGEN